MPTLTKLFLFLTAFFSLMTSCVAPPSAAKERKVGDPGTFTWESVEMKVFKSSNCRINPWNESVPDGAGQPAEMPKASFETDLGPHCQAKESEFMKLFTAMADHGEWSPEDRKCVLVKADLCPSAEGKEWIAAFVGSRYCGSGGCTLFLFYSDMTPMHKVTVAGHGSVWVSGTLKNGWYPLLLQTREGNVQVDLSNQEYLLNASTAEQMEEAAWTQIHKSQLFDLHRDKTPF